ncbi:hypothetical protein KXX11_003988, partial [Aspergillus fumigatus]
DSERQPGGVTLRIRNRAAAQPSILSGVTRNTPTPTPAPATANASATTADEDVTPPPGQAQTGLGIRSGKTKIGRGEPRQPDPVAVLARIEPDRGISRHRQAKDAFPVAVHLGRIAVAPLGPDVVDILEGPIAQMTSGVPDIDPGLFKDLAPRRGFERLLREVLAA